MTPVELFRGTRRSFLQAAALVLLILIVYLPGMGGGFLWDDRAYLHDNLLIRAPDGLYRFWFTAEADDYYPLSASVFWLEWRLWGTSAAGYRVVNVVLHTLGCLLIWQVLRRLRVPGAWLASLIFAVHPVNVASVAWISELKNTLALVFYALTFRLYLEFEHTGRRGLYWFSLGAFFLALTSKSAVVMLPVVLLGFAWWQRGRVGRVDVARSLPFFALSLVLGLVTVWFQYHQVLDEAAVVPASFWDRLARSGWVVWFYLSKAVLPLSLSMIYPNWELNAASPLAWLPSLALLGCLLGCWWYRRSWGRAPGFALGYFAVTLFPVMGFFDQGFYVYSKVSDHWQYFSLIGVLALAVAAAGHLRRRWPGLPLWSGPVTTGLIVGLLGVATARRAWVFRESETLWRDTLAKNPRAWVAHNNLGIALQHLQRFSEAKQHFREAIRLHPVYPDPYYNLGFEFDRQGQLEQAKAYYREALNRRPNYAAAHNNLGMVLTRQGELEEAVSHYEEALRAQPVFAEAHHNLANALLKMGNTKAAINHLSEAVRCDAEYAPAHYGLGHLWARQGRLDAAVAHFLRAVQLQPESSEYRFHLGVALGSQGEGGAGLAYLQEAARLKPDWWEPAAAVAWVLATHPDPGLRNGSQAVAFAERARELTGGQDPRILDILAAAHAEAGQFPEAIKLAGQALALAGQSGRSNLATDIEARLHAYQKLRPYHQTAPPAAAEAQ